MPGRSLEYENWLYHLDHLIGHIEVAVDCKVCCWHAGLNHKTVREMSIAANAVGSNQYQAKKRANHSRNGLLAITLGEVH